MRLTPLLSPSAFEKESNKQRGRIIRVSIWVGFSSCKETGTCQRVQVLLCHSGCPGWVLLVPFKMDISHSSGRELTGQLHSAPCRDFIGFLHLKEISKHRSSEKWMVLWRVFLFWQLLSAGWDAELGVSESSLATELLSLSPDLYPKLWDV